jgi:hypothetical protein
LANAGDRWFTFVELIRWGWLPHVFILKDDNIEIDSYWSVIFPKPHRLVEGYKHFYVFSNLKDMQAGC